MAEAESAQPLAAENVRGSASPLIYDPTNIALGIRSTTLGASLCLGCRPNFLMTDLLAALLIGSAILVALGIFTIYTA